MSRTGLGLLLSAAFLLAACGDPSANIGGSTTSATPPSPTTSTTVVLGGDLEVIVLPGPDGELPSELIVSCPSGPLFPISALEEVPPLAVADPGGVKEAIAPFLESEEANSGPRRTGGYCMRPTTKSCSCTMATRGSRS